MRTERIETGLRTEFIGRSLLHFEQLPSTNTYCAQNGGQLPDGALVLAEAQSAGKGSRGREWHSPKSNAIYMSLVLKPDIPPECAPRLTPVMALSIVRALEKLGVDARIKWPNDVVAHGKKLVGILTEMHLDGGRIGQVIIGVGMNVSNRHFSEELKERATSLYMETGKEFQRETLIAGILNCFEEDYKAFLSTCDLSQLLEQYKQFSVTIGRQVQILGEADSYSGYAEDVDAGGRLLVCRDDGKRTWVYADEVSVRGIYGYV